MIKCQNCGNLNAPESHFCRFCGTRFVIGPQISGAPKTEPPSYDFPAPRPYSWKTDEFTVQNESRKTAGGTPDIAAPIATVSPSVLDRQYQCPNCRSTYLPRVERRISTGGWITFAVLLVAFFPLFWIGLLIKEEIRVCPVCQYQVS